VGFIIRIAVCDDDKNIAENIHRHVEMKAKQLQGEKLDIFFYKSGLDFLQDIELGATFHIVFMDIEMEEMNGVEAGQILRNRSNGDDIIMIYVSSHDSYFEDLVDVGSFRFIKKPIDEDRLDHVFSKALNQAIKYKNMAEEPSLFFFKVGAEISSVKADEIAYLKNIKRIIEIHVWDNTSKSIILLDHFYSNMDDAMEQLPKGQFVRSERSHIVNLEYVCRMNSDYFTFMDKNSTKIPIGRVHKENAKVAYFKRRSDKYV